MCGIVYKHNFDGSPVNDDIFDQFFAQRDRGLQGFGLYDGEYMHMVKSANENRIVKWLAKYPSNLLLFHHRWPTSTANVARAAHPISTYAYFGKTQYIMVHNGCIRNSDELFEAHAELGINYKTLLDDLSFNDSEALLWDFALTMEGKQKEMKAYGDMAFIVLKLYDGKLKKMMFGKNYGRPLIMYKDKETIELSSEGRGEPIECNKLYSWVYSTKHLYVKEMEFSFSAPFVSNSYNTWKSSFSHSNNYDRFVSQGQVPSLGAGDDDDDDDLTGYWDKEENRWIAIPQRYTDNFTDNFQDHVTEQTRKRKLILDIDAICEADYEPTSEEIQNKAMEYLSAKSGNLEAAYWEAEMDYCDAEDEEATFDNIRKRLLYQSVMKYIDLDPDYKDENSISAEWRAIWQQTVIYA